VVGHTTKHMTHSHSWNVEIWRPEVENVTLGLRPRVTFQPRVVIFSCPTYYRASSVNCNDDYKHIWKHPAAFCKSITIVGIFLMTVVTSWCSTGSQKPHGYCPLCIRLKISAMDKPKVLPHSQKVSLPISGSTQATVQYMVPLVPEVRPYPK